MMTRRDFVVTAAGTGLALMAGLPVRAAGFRRAATFFEWKEVAPGLFAGTGRTGDNMQVVSGNMLVVKGKEGTALVDTGQAILGLTIRREAALLGVPLLEVFNTHHHFDHAGGNHAFTGDTKVLGHPKCKERLLAGGRQMVAALDQRISALEALQIEGAKEAAADAKKFKEGLAGLKQDAFAPTGVIEKDQELTVAGMKADVMHIGAGHTDNDLVFHFREANVVVTGDLVFNGLHPYFDVGAGANSAGWIRSLEKIESLCNEKTVVVPGHGAVSDRTLVKTQIAYFKGAVESAKKAVADGVSKQDFAKAGMPGYEGYGLKVAQGLVLNAVYDEAAKAAGKAP